MAQQEEIHLYFYDEISSGLEQYIQNELSENPQAKHIYAHFNSPGGGVYVGWTCGNIISNSGIPSTALVEGYCGSIATYMALSCDVVKIAPAATWMIHNASVQIQGNKHDLMQGAKELDQIDKDLRKKYIEKCESKGISEIQINEWMEKETSFDSEMTLKTGFADAKMTPLKAVAKFDITQLEMTEKQVNDKLSIMDKITNKLLSLVKNESEDVKNMDITLEDGTQLFVMSEDGEFEGKQVFVSNEEGERTDTPAPDGTHLLSDGRKITVEGGIIVSVEEDATNEDDEEVEKFKETIEDLKNQLAAKEEEAKTAKTEADTITSKFEETTKTVEELVNEVKNFKEMTAGSTFKADKALIQPENKSTEKPKAATGHSLDGFASALKKF